MRERVRAGGRAGDAAPVQEGGSGPGARKGSRDGEKPARASWRTSSHFGVPKERLPQGVEGVGRTRARPMPPLPSGTERGRNLRLPTSTGIQVTDAET